MNLKNTLALGLGLLLLQFSAVAQDELNDTKEKKKHFFSSNSGIEAHNLQFVTLNKGGTTINVSPRYSYYFNIGFDVNAHVTKYVKPFTGLYLKNIGLITHEGNVSQKHRIYAIGIPLGLKFYTCNRKSVLKLGADFNYALNYKQKTFVDDKKTEKFNEWNSERTPSWLPSMFVGLRYYGLSVTANYYYNNFFNQDFVENGIKPYANTEANMMTISIGYNIDNKGASRKLKKKLMKAKTENKA